METYGTGISIKRLKEWIDEGFRISQSQFSEKTGEPLNPDVPLESLDRAVHVIQNANGKKIGYLSVEALNVIRNYKLMGALSDASGNWFYGVAR